MELGSILLSLLLGLFVVRTVHPSPTFAEYAGLSIPLGLFVQTIFMILLDCMNIPITRLSLFLMDSVILVALGYCLYKKGISWKSCLLFWQTTLRQVKSINLVWLLLIGFIAWYEYENLERCLFFPTYDRDSLVGFDTIGFVLSKEHTFKNLSIFNAAYVPDIKHAGSYIAYAPFVQLAYGYVYLFGAETSKLIPALMFLSLLISFYAVLARNIRKTGAALATLLLLLTPQLLAFSTMSSTNVMHALFASLGTIYGFMWLRDKQQGDLSISALLLGANCWTRSEGILFVVALGVPLLIDSLRKSSFKPFLFWSAIALTPSVGWFVVQQLFNLRSENIIIAHPFWDEEKMGLIWDYLFKNFTNTFYYGWTFLLLVISLVVNGWFLIKEKDNLIPLFVLAGSIFLYGIILYHINYKWDTIDNVLNYSAKRFIFCFVPIALYYALTNKVFATFLRRVDKWLDISDVH